MSSFRQSVSQKKGIPIIGTPLQKVLNENYSGIEMLV